MSLSLAGSHAFINLLPFTTPRYGRHLIYCHIRGRALPLTLLRKPRRTRMPYTEGKQNQIRLAGGPLDFVEQE